MTLDTTEYQAIHGKKPSGRGTWAFRLEKKKRGTDGPIVWPDEKDFRKAVSRIEDDHADEGYKFIVVMP